MADIFLSYAREDRDAASRLVTALEAEGWSVWWDAEIIPGQEFPPAIRQALEEAKCVVVLWSADSVSSSYVEAEATRARARGVLVPVAIDTVMIPVPFNTLHTVSLLGWSGGRQDDAFRPLVRAAHALIAKEPTDGPGPGPDAGAAEGDRISEGLLSEHTFLQQLLGLQLAVTKLPTSGVKTDEALGVLTRFAADLARTVEDFPEGLAGCQDLVLCWNAAVDDRLACDAAPMTRLLLSQARSRLKASIARSQEQAGATGPRTLAELGLGAGASFDARRLVSQDPIERSDAVDALLQKGFESAERHLSGLGDAEDRRRILVELWRSWPRIRLHHAKAAGPLAGFALHTDPSFWHPRLEALDRLSRTSARDDAAVILESFQDHDRRALAQTLLVNRSLACRQLALDALDTAERWDTVLFQGTPMLLVREIVCRCCLDCEADYVKVLFLLLRRRLEEVTRAPDIREAYEIMRAFYRLPLFLEEEFFASLVELHGVLSRKALVSPELAHLEHDSLETFKSFCAREKLQDADISQMAHIPLPIQRKLARDGHFIGYFIRNVRDAIALETVPHVIRKADVVKFIRMPQINGQALLTIAKDKNVMREYSHRLAFCHNPRAKGAQVVTHMSSLRSFDWDEIAKDKNASQHAREQAKRLLSRAHH